VHHSNRHVALASMNMSVYKTRLLMKPLITFVFFLPLCNLPTFKLPGNDCCLVTKARPRRLHSAETRSLVVSRTCTNFADRAFSAAGPRVELSADGPHTVALVMQPFQTVTGNIFIWSVGP